MFEYKFYEMFLLPYNIYLLVQLGRPIRIPIMWVCQEIVDLKSDFMSF